jgi:hypothetical protein
MKATVVKAKLKPKPFRETDSNFPIGQPLPRPQENYIDPKKKG